MLPSNSQRDEARNSIIALLSSLRTPSLRDESWVPRLLQSIVRFSLVVRAHRLIFPQQMYLYHDPCFQEDQPRNSLLSALLTIHTKPNLLSTSERETLYFRIGPLWDNLVEWVGENPAEYGHFIPMLQSLNLLPACIPPRPTPSSPLDNSTVASSSPPSSQAPISSLAPSRAISMAPDSSSAPDDHRAVSPHQRRTVRFESLSVSSPPSSPMQAQSHFPEVGVLYGVEVGMEGAENDGSQSSDTVQTREEKQVDGAELPGDKEGNSDSFASEKSEAAVDAKDTEMDAVTSLEGESGKADAVYEKNGGSDAMEVDGASHNSSDEEQADPPTKKRKLLGRQATATEDKLFTGKDRVSTFSLIEYLLLKSYSVQGVENAIWMFVAWRSRTISPWSASSVAMTARGVASLTVRRPRQRVRKARLKQRGPPPILRLKLRSPPITKTRRPLTPRL